MAGKRRIFSREFKLEAVGLMTDESLSVAQASRYLGISESVFGRWKRQFVEDPAEAFPGKGRLKAQDEDPARFRCIFEVLRQERGILKKTVGIFSRVPK